MKIEKNRNQRSKACREKSAEVIVTDKGCNRQLCEGLNFTLNKYYYIITYERRNAENNSGWLPSDR